MKIYFVKIRVNLWLFSDKKTMILERPKIRFNIMQQPEVFNMPDYAFWMLDFSESHPRRIPEYPADHIPSEAHTPRVTNEVIIV
jgi:hypothetical protein